jgi:hypothetical protein
LVALLAASLAATPAFPDGVGTRQITDTFSGNTIDPKIWWSGGNRPDAVAVSQAEGRLTVNLSGRAGNDFNAGVGTLCRATGFDARISFDLSAWPAFMESGSPDGLRRRCESSGNVYRASASWGDSYGAYYPSSGGTSVTATGSRGAMRLVRRGTTMNGYYWAGSQWVSVFAGEVPLSDVSFNLSVSTISGATQFGHDWATIQLDNFIVTADVITCS